MTRAGALALALAACSGGDGRPDECVVPGGVDPDWIGELGCEADYELLEDDTDDAVFAHTRTINWLIDREDDDQLYFIDTTEFLLHYFFAARYLDYGEPFTPVGTHAEFNTLNYRRENRRFVMGKLVRYLDQGLLTIEFSAGDTAGADMIADAYDRVQGAIHDGAELVYRPVSAQQEEMLPELEARIPVIRTEAVFQGQSYQPLNQRVGYGTLRFRKLVELEGEPLSPTDIVVLDRVPNDITLVSGIVTEEFQTPLSHVNVLSKNRGTPNMALRGAFDDPDLRALEDALVRLEVGPQEFAVAEASPADAQAYWDSLRPSEPLSPAFDLTATALIDLAGAGRGDSIRIGAKAANLAEVLAIRLPGERPIATPEDPFAVPFHFYDQFMKDSGLEAEVAALLADAPDLAPQELGERLFDLRWKIYRAPLDPAVRDLVAAQAAARWGEDAQVRFRSSTNVEDLPDFSGAGLYTSAGADLASGAQAVENAMKVVYASAWNQQAFIERDFYRVDHARVRMALLVHPSMPDEMANGVAVTINEFADNRPAFYINAQLGEVSVTNPTGLATPEQLLYYTWYEEPEYEIITRSSLVARVPDWPTFPAVLSEPELETLAEYLTAIHNHFKAGAGPDPDFAMDVEWKLAPGRVIVIKQARPLVRR
ncbi:MAG TPA: PEP/pyruvate-binding domain-containing protein [Kofleriaceae bacterium]|nr:PEP/pyruvate-binding domain-containing protein [Kofleriaceae bacterium]